MNLNVRGYKEDKSINSFQRGHIPIVFIALRSWTNVQRGQGQKAILRPDEAPTSSAAPRRNIGIWQQKGTNTITGLHAVLCNKTVSSKVGQEHQLI